MRARLEVNEPRCLLGEDLNEADLEVRSIVVGGCAYETQAATLAGTGFIVRSSVTRERSADVDVEDQSLRAEELLDVARRRGIYGGRGAPVRWVWAGRVPIGWKARALFDSHASAHV